MRLNTSHNRERNILTKNALFLFCFSLLSIAVYSQSDTIRYEAGIATVASTGNFAPFWLHSDRYGKISSSPMSTLVFTGIEKQYTNTRNKFDYGFKAGAIVRTDYHTNEIYLNEIYAKARYTVFYILAGSREQIFGNQDSTLSSGGLLFSKNARPMPEIVAGIENFTPVPLTFGFLELKGSMRQGWFTDNIYTRGIMLHHKFGYVRLGGKLPVHVQYGLEHVAQWGGTDPVTGPLPHGLKNFGRIFLAKSGGEDASLSDQINVLGNHLISQGFKVEADVAGIRVNGYWQNISEDRPIKFIGSNEVNKPDGLWGISVKSNKFPFIKGVLYELLNTTDQSGPYHDKDGLIYGGTDGYFGGAYPVGWSYYSRTIGTPFITSPLYNENGALSTTNNRVRLHHFGIEGSIEGFEYRALASFSRNYGTYGSFVNIPNKSFLLEVNKHISLLSGFDLSCAAGGDVGKFYGNSVGIMVSIRKTGFLFGY